MMMVLLLLVQSALILVGGYTISRWKHWFMTHWMSGQKLLPGHDDYWGRLSSLYNNHCMDHGISSRPFLLLLFVVVVVVVLWLLFLLRMDFLLFQPQTILAAAGGMMSAALMFGSRDLAEHLVGGFIIATWDVFYVGDTVRLHDCGIEGKVQRIGLLDTAIEGYDNIIVMIPNAKVYNQRVSNLSRIQISQVKLTLRFKYSDLRKIPLLLQDIQKEIVLTCSPLLILDGSRPFRAHLIDYKDDHVEVCINCHFGIRPRTAAYADCRQKVLLAISSTVQKNGLEFAIPSSVFYQGSHK